MPDIRNDIRTVIADFSMINLCRHTSLPLYYISGYIRICCFIDFKQTSSNETLRL